MKNVSHKLNQINSIIMYPPNSTFIIYKLFLCTILFVNQMTSSQSLSNGGDHESSSLFCESWRFSVEANNAGNWSAVPDRCLEFVRDYMTGDRYKSDFELTAKNVLEFAKSAEIAEDGKDAWIFDVDETLLSFLPYYETHGFGKTDEKEFIRWGLHNKLPALQASLSLYNEIHQLGFKIFLLTGRPEWLREYSTTNLIEAGYNNWERLILRQTADEKKTAIDYKTEKRKELIDEGYRIVGNVGDQWSDLMGYPVAQRSFKYPNLMYYVA